MKETRSMLSDENAFLIDLAHWPARQPHEVIAAFCPCSMSASTGACSRRRTGALTVTAGYFSTGEIGEVFLATGKGGSDLASLVRDAAITLSLALQHGVKIETLQHAVLRDARGEPLSLIGAVVDELAQVRP